MSPILVSDVLTPRQLAFIAERVPEPPRAPGGRRPYANLELLPGILRVLRSGCRWRVLDRRGSRPASPTGADSATGTGRPAIAGSGARS